METINTNTNSRLNNIYLIISKCLIILTNNLETKRLILRPFNQDDFELFSNILKDHEVSKNLKYVLRSEFEQNIDILFQAIINSNNRSGSIFALVISNKEIKEDIGSCGFTFSEENNETVCFYMLMPRFRGNGFAIEAMKKLIEYAFLNLNLPKLTIYINPKSSGIWKVAERTGMKYMGQIELNKIYSKAMFFSIEKKEFTARQLY
ncbi:MAG: GNAT family N-acetyltransferase [Candidatus Hodarchaeota archaeon]